MGQNKDINSRITLGTTAKGFILDVPPCGFLDQRVHIAYLPAFIILFIQIYIDWYAFSTHLPVNWTHLARTNLLFVCIVLPLLLIPVHYALRRVEFTADRDTLKLTYASPFLSWEKSWDRKDIGDVDLERCKLIQWKTTITEKLRWHIRLLDHDGTRIALLLGGWGYSEQLDITKRLREGLRLGEFK